MAKPYQINYATNTITITKSFNDKANNLEGEAFNTMMTLRSLNMQIVIEEPAPRKKSFRPTYKQMENYISCLAEREHYMKEYQTICKKSESNRNKYQAVLNWFRATFPDFEKVPTFNEDFKIIVTANKSEQADTSSAA